MNVEKASEVLKDLHRLEREFSSSIAAFESALQDAGTTAAPGKVISIAEAAARLGTSRYTIMRMMKSGELRAFVRKGSKRASGVWEDSIAK